jgi:hypothetical protein
MEHMPSHDVVAGIVPPPRDGKRPYLERSEFARLLGAHTADAGLSEDLAVLSGDTTD